MTNKKTKDKDSRDGTTKRLDAIIRLMMDTQRDPSKKVTKNDQVEILHSVGLKDTEIGLIIGQPRNEVASIRTHAKKVKKK
jgi:hypothetical protein